MRRLHLYQPHLPIGLATARASEPFPPGPLVLGGRPWDPGTVIDANREARALGVRRGIPLGSAHRLAPEAVFVEPDPDRERTAAEAVFEALAASSPGLAGSTDPADGAFGLFEVLADGLGPLWGPEPALIERLTRVVRETLPAGAGTTVRAGLAGTHFAATIAAVHAHPDAPIIVPPGDDAAFLASYPSGLLSQDPDVRARLARFGLRRIGAVAELARSALVARFGEEGSRLYARARGEETEPFRPRRTPERLALALPIEPASDDLASVRFVLHRLAGALTDQLRVRGLAATRAHLRLTLDLAFAPTGTAAEVMVEQRFPEPTADADAIDRLLFARLERTPPVAAVEAVHLELAGAGPATGQQLPLFVPQAARDSRLGWQLARLALTFGEDRVRRVALLDPEAPLPESRWTWRGVDLEGSPS
jgi:protein ImuB